MSQENNDNRDNGQGYIPEQPANNPPSPIPDGQLNYPFDKVQFT